MHYFTKVNINITLMLLFLMFFDGDNKVCFNITYMLNHNKIVDELNNIAFLR